MYHMAKNGVSMAESFLISTSKRGRPKMKTALSILLIISSFVNAQSKSMSELQTDKLSMKSKNKLTGILNIDSKISFEETKSLNQNFSDQEAGSKKTPILAAGMSLLLPGAGEFYSERYVKSGVFLAVEATAIILGLVYDKKGDQQTDDAHNYANGANGWSVYRYANWTLTNIKKLNPSLNPDDYAGKVIRSDGSVDYDWLNKLERAVGAAGTTGSYYSHQLPPHGTQQYYELIGKYDQFNVGWKQFGDNPNKEYIYGSTQNVPQFKEYSDMFYKADDYYNVAAKAVLVIIANHVISAFDAALSAKSFNKDIEVHASLEKFNNGLTLYYYPQLNLQYSF